MKYYIGIDNGVTGHVAVVSEDGRVLHYAPVPTKKELSYTKKVQHITRIDNPALRKLLRKYKMKGLTKVVIERPLVTPKRFKASLSAMRALESVLVAIEHLKLPYQYIDSKEWQKALLPDKVKETKKAAVQVAGRLFPDVDTKDADALLIAEYARRNNL